MMIKFKSVGDIVLIECKGSEIFVQVGGLSQGTDLFYGNNADSMGVETLTIDYNQELFEEGRVKCQPPQMPLGF